MIVKPPQGILESTTTDLLPRYIWISGFKASWRQYFFARPTRHDSARSWLLRLLELRLTNFPTYLLTYFLFCTISKINPMNIYNGRLTESRIGLLSNGTIFNDLERPLPPVSRSLYSLTLNISETVRDSCNEILIRTYALLNSVISNDLEWCWMTLATYLMTRIVA